MTLSALYELDLPSVSDAREALCAAVVPAYRCRDKVIAVIESIPAIVERIYLVDDACPEQTGRFVEAECKDPRVKVIYHTSNTGVGGAVITGYRQALEEGAVAVVKIDGDGQMDGSLVPNFLEPLLRGEADYTKGNRFFDLESLSCMPPVRLFGNSILSFINKAVSGYWNVMDPTNGFTAIHCMALRHIPLAKLEKRYFFESDVLFRLGTVRAVVKEIPMDAKYADEQSSLRIGHTIMDFPRKYLLRAFKRLFYMYFLRDFTVVSICLLAGTFLTLLGTFLGVLRWVQNAEAGTFASTGTVMLASIPILIGVQLLLVALVLDVTNVPKESLSSNSRNKRIDVLRLPPSR